MLLTKECDYGIRIIRALAENEKKTVEAICNIEFIPSQYAYKILKKLEQKGFVKSQQGRSGGYKLIMPTRDITIYDVATAVHDDLLIFQCLREDSVCPRNTPEELCGVHREFVRLQNMLVNEMRRKPLNELLSG